MVRMMVVVFATVPDYAVADRIAPQPKAGAKC
jgi:hypothetical protein